MEARRAQCSPWAEYLTNNRAPVDESEVVRGAPFPVASASGGPI